MKKTLQTEKWSLIKKTCSFPTITGDFTPFNMKTTHDSAPPSTAKTKASSPTAAGDIRPLSTHLSRLYLLVVLRVNRYLIVLSNFCHFSAFASVSGRRICSSRPFCTDIEPSSHFSGCYYPWIPAL